MKRKITPKILLTSFVITQTTFLSGLSSCSQNNGVKNINGTDWKGVTFGEFGKQDYIVDNKKQIVTYVSGIAIHAFDLVIPDYVSYHGKNYKVLLGENCFANCSGLSGSVELNQFIVNIPKNCFTNCFNMTGLFCRAYPTTIGDFAFSGCILLVQIRIKHKDHLSNDWAMELRSVGNYAFANAWLDGDLNFGANLQFIGKFAFSYCHKITNVNLIHSKQLYYINDGAFRGCANIKSVYLPDSITHICDEAFTYCSWLQTINFPSSHVEISIGNKAFQQCKNFTGFKPVCRIKEIGEGCFAFDSNISDYPWLYNYGLNYIPPTAFASCGYSSLVFEPNHPKNVGDNAFTDCENLVALDFSAFKSNESPPNWNGKHIFAGALTKNGTVYMNDLSQLNPQWKEFLANNDITIKTDVSDGWEFKKFEGIINSIIPPEEAARTIHVELTPEGEGTGVITGFSFESRGYIDISKFSLFFSSDSETRFNIQMINFDSDTKTFDILFHIKQAQPGEMYQGNINIYYDEEPVYVTEDDIYTIFTDGSL